jgi:hypothetical protein
MQPVAVPVIEEAGPSVDGVSVRHASCDVVAELRAPRGGVNR